MALVRFSPMNDVMNLQREMNRFVDSFFPNRDTEGDAAGISTAVWRPVVDVHEDENNYFVDAELPGLRKEDVKISYQDGVLSLAGERKFERETPAPTFASTESDQANGEHANGGGGEVGNGGPNGNGKKARSYHRMERFYGRFHRTFTFPAAVNPDVINAKFENGVLHITVPKAEQVRPRQIEIS